MTHYIWKKLVKTEEMQTGGKVNSFNIVENLWRYGELHNKDTERRWKAERRAKKHERKNILKDGGIKVLNDLMENEDFLTGLL